MKLSALKPRSVTLLVILPVLLAGGITSAIAVHVLNTTLTTYLKDRAYTQIDIAASLALEKCEENFEDLLSLRLENDQAMIRTMKNDAVNHITDLKNRFPNLHFIIAEEGEGVVETTLPDSESTSYSKVSKIAKETIVPVTIGGKKGYAGGRYFPFFRLYIAAFVYEEDVFLPLAAGGRIITFSLAAVAAVFSGTLILVFFFFVRRPLMKLMAASGEVAKGKYPTISSSRKDEIGRLYSAFNSMVEDLEETGRREQAVFKELQESLEEKKVLLGEIHHRVKNNLNIVVSLLRLQSDYIDTPEKGKQALEESRSRVYSMALVHERLYKSENLSHIDIKSYVEYLAQDLVSLYAPEKSISLNLDIVEAELDITTAVPLGLIINEILTNSLIHAFPDRKEGHIFIRFALADEETYELDISDDGRGKTAAAYGREHQGLGLTLIELLTSQLDGELSTDASKGTRYCIRIPRK